MQSQEKKTIDLDQEFIVLSIPSSTMELDIKAQIYIDRELVNVCRHMDFQEVRDAIKEAQDGYIPGDALFVLAPTGREKLEKLLDRYSAEEDK